MRSLITFLLILVLIYGCSNQKQKTDEVPVNEKIVPVKAGTVSAEEVTERIILTGDIQSIKSVNIFSKVNGIVKARYFGEGDYVNIGDLLGDVEQDIPGMKYEIHKIEATEKGVITRSAFEAGDRVTTQQPVAVITKNDKVFFTAKVFESNLNRIKKGDKFNIELDAFKDKYFIGAVDEISPVVDPTSRTADIKILIDNKINKIKPGMFGHTQLDLGRHKGLVVPIDAIVRSGADFYLFKIDNGKVIRVSVATGIISGNTIEVSGSIIDGDKIVVYGQNLLEEGTKIKIIN
ncbi:MAG: efflux RND transporter periplasmic adaptor subunit [Ignavibacteriaceae bacterium]|jgi:multidrug efflux pump subunit AcrA (membrane-fusion protein)|nr:efflux RND transporter periplasmic adaptor subunit [Ignavibacteriaceae bacterium]